MATKIKDYIPTVEVRGSRELDLLRARYIRAFNQIDSITEHTISSKDSGRLDRVCWEYYKDRTYWWALARYNNIVSPLEEVVPGLVIQIPPESSLENALSSANTRKVFRNSSITLR